VRSGELRGRVEIEDDRWDPFDEVTCCVEYYVDLFGSQQCRDANTQSPTTSNENNGGPVEFWRAT